MKKLTRFLLVLYDTIITAKKLLLTININIRKADPSPTIYGINPTGQHLSDLFVLKSINKVEHEHPSRLIMSDSINRS